MRRIKPQGFFFTGNHPQHDDAAFKQIELCGVDLQTNRNLKSILTDEHLEILGEIDEDWFENTAVKECSRIFEESKKPVIGVKGKQQDDDCILTTKGKDSEDGHLCLQETPVRKDFKSTTSEFNSPPPLFTPDLKGKTLIVTDGACHSTPSVNAESQTFSPLIWTGQDPDDCKVESAAKLPSVGISPLRYEECNTAEGTPQFLRNMPHLQTPSTVNRTQETLSMSALQQTLDRKLRPTPQRLSKSLGGEVNDLNLSWTSSMATPLSAAKATEKEATDWRTISVTRGTDSPQTWKPIIAKVLFASTGKKPQKEPKLLQSEGSSEALPSLHFSSTEDEEETSDQEKGDNHPGKRNDNLESRKKDSSCEIKRVKKVKERKGTPLKVKMGGLCGEKRKTEENLETGGNNLMKVEEKKEMETSDLEASGPEKKRQKADEDVDSDWRKKVHRPVEVNLEKEEPDSCDHQRDGLHENKSVEGGDYGDLGKLMKNEGVDHGKDRTEGNVKCGEMKETLKTGKMDIDVEELFGMEKCTMETKEEIGDDSSEEEREKLTLARGRGLEEVEIYHGGAGSKIGASASNEIGGCCGQISDRKVNVEARDREQDLQQVQNVIEKKRAASEDTDDAIVTSDVTEKGREQIEIKSSDGESQISEERQMLGCSILEVGVKSETVPITSYTKESCGGESSNTTHLNSTQIWNTKYIQGTPQTPHQSLQKDEVCTEDVEDGCNVAVMSPSVEAGLYGRLALLAETLNIPLAQMIEADRKARKLQEAALRKATPPSNHPKLHEAVLKKATSPDNHLELQEAALKKVTPPNNHPELQEAALKEATPLYNHSELQETTLRKATPLNNHAKIPEEALRKTTPPNNQAGLISDSNARQNIEMSSQGNILDEGMQQQTEQGTCWGGISAPDEVSGFEAKKDTEESKEEPVVKSAIQTERNSPPNLLPDGSQSNGSEKSLNIADTLAFFLATPPLMQRRKATLGQVPSTTASNGEEMSQTGCDMEVSKVDNNIEKGQNLNTSPPALSKKDVTTVTPPHVDSSPNACLFSPLTPSTTEALLRATDAISSSLESDGKSKDVEVNNNTRNRNECNLLGASTDNLKERQMDDEAEIRENSLSIKLQVQSAKDSCKGTDKSSKVNKDGEIQSYQEESGKTLASGKVVEEITEKNGEEEDEFEKNVDSPVSFLKVGKSLSARRFLYPTSDTKTNVKPSLLTWKQNAVFDDSYLEEQDQNLSEKKEELPEACKNPESGAGEKKLFNRARTGQFQTFTSFLLTEQKECDRQGGSLRLEEKDDKKNDQFMEKNLQRTVRETRDLPSKSDEMCELNEGFLTDPPEPVHVDGPSFSGQMERVWEGWEGRSSSHKMGPGGDATRKKSLFVEELEDEGRCREERDETKHGRSCEEDEIIPKNIKCSILEQSPFVSKWSDDRVDRLTQHAGSRTDLSSEIIDIDKADGEGDFPSTKERNRDTLSQIREGKVTLNTETKEMALVIEQSANANALSAPTMHADPSFVGFRSALGKKIEISASALEKAKDFLQELELAEAVVTEPSRKDSNVQDNRNLTNLPIAEMKKYDMMSPKFDGMDGNFYKSEKAVFGGFTNGTGKPIQISAKALKDAELLLEKFESEEMENVGSTADKKSTMFVDMGSNKDRDNCQELSNKSDLGCNSLRNTTFASKNDIIKETGAVIENSRLGKNVLKQRGLTKPAQCLSKKYDPSKNYTHLPKGFRPFKPPGRKVTASEKNVSMVQKVNKYPQDTLQVECQKYICEDAKMPKQVQNEDIRHSRVSANGECKIKLPDMDHGEFEEEENDAHIVREIAAAEEAEMLYDFMKDEDEIVDTQIDTLLTASAEEVRATKHIGLTFDLRSHLKETGSKLIKDEKCRCPAAFNGNDVCLSGDGFGDKMGSGKKFVEDEKQITISKSHCHGEVKNGEKSKINYILNGSVDVTSVTGNTPTSQTMLLNSDDSQVKEFVGFQTAGGAKILVSDEALVKAKKFLWEEDSEVNIKASESSCSDKNENDQIHDNWSALHQDFKASMEDGKKSSALDATCKELKSGQFQGEKRKSILRSGESNIPKKLKTLNMPQVSCGNGKKVRFLEESLQNVQGELKTGMSQGNKCIAASKFKDGFSSFEDGGRKDFEGYSKRTLQSSHTGFQTGNGKQVTISEEALVLARQAWCDEGLVGDCDIEGSDSKISLPKEGANSRKDSPKDCISFATGHQSCKENQNLDGSHIPDDHNLIRIACKKESGVPILPTNFVNNSSSAEGSVSMSVDDVDHGRTLSEPGMRKTDECGPEEKERKLPAVLPSGPLGFHTARGVSIKISEAALEKAKKLWSEDETLEQSVLGGVSYQQALPIEDSKSGHLLKDDVSEQGEIIDKTGKSLPLSRFQSADSSKVKISDASLEKVNNHRSIDVKVGRNINSPEGMRDLPGGRDERVESSIGFHTAKGTKVTVSDAALKRAKQFWREEVLESPKKQTSTVHANEKLSKGLERSIPSETYSGFQTGRGSKVKISVAALEKAKSLWSEETNTDPPGKRRKLEGSPVMGLMQGELKGTFSGFQTANGSKVNISQEALEKARSRWSEDEMDLQFLKKLQESDREQIYPEKSASSTTSGFQTASGSKIAISSSALEKATKFLEDDSPIVQENSRTKIANLPTDCAEKHVNNSNPKMIVCGFQTGNGAKVQISAAAMEKAKQLWTDNVECGQEKETKLSTNQILSGVISGFQTSKGSSVTISQASLQKVQSLFKEEEENMAQGDVSLLHKEAAFPSSMDVKSKQNTTQRYFPGAVKGEETGLQASENTMKNSTSLQEDRTGLVVTAIDQETKGVLHMKIPPRNEGQQFPARCQSSPAASLRPVDLKGLTRHSHTSQFLLKMQKGPSPSTSVSGSFGGNYLPQRSCPANVLLDRATTPRPLVSSCSSESTVREPPTNARVFKKRVNMETSDNEKGHEEIDLKQVWQQARTSQLTRIQDKKKTVIKPKPGYLSKHRIGKQKISLRAAVDQMLPTHCSKEEILSAGVLPSTLNVSASTSSSYRFKAGDFFSHETLASPEGIFLGDGGRLVPSEDGTVGAEEFKIALLDTSGVDPALVSSDWVENHFRWIVWKLASMEVAYPIHFGGRLLTPDRVLLQLKYRYDREIDQSQRSALKKILERDEAASRRIVLCVAGILETQSPKADDTYDNTADKSLKDAGKNAKQCCHLLLTDGWYAVKTIIDTPLVTQVETGKICIGTKLCLSGGELVGSQDACSPLEIPESLSFRISYNSTRRAKFDTRLGIQRDPRPFPIPLRSVCGNGGTVGCVDIVIARVYPMQFMEKYPNGSSVFRTLKAEEKAAAEFSKAKQRRMEMLYSQIQKKFEEKKIKESQCKKLKRSCKFTQEEVLAMTTGEELFAALTSSLDPGFLESCMTQRQVGLLQDYQRSVQEKHNQEVQEELRSALAKQEEENTLERKVVSLIKIRIADYYGRQRGNPSSTSMLTIWRPAEDLISQLMEGRRFLMTNLSASGARFQWNSSNAQLASSRSTRYLERQTQKDILESMYQPREAVSLQSLVTGCHESIYGEVDVVGLVAAVKGESGGLQKVYLTDEHCHLVEVRFWNGLRSHHLEEVIQPGKFIAASNLQIRGTETSVLHVTELALFSMNPKSKLLQHSLAQLKNRVKDVKAILLLVEESIDQLTNCQKSQQPVTRISNSTISSSGYSSASNSFFSPPSENDWQRKDQNNCRDAVTHHWVPYEGNVSVTPASSLQVNTSSTPPVAQWSQFAKRTPQAKDGISQFCRKNTAASNSEVISDPSQETMSAKKKDLQRRSSLLARIPSPPPLTPLLSYTPSTLKKEFRTPVRGSTPSSVPKLSVDSTLKISAEKKAISVYRNSEVFSLTDREDANCVLDLKKNFGKNSLEDPLTATQAARLEVCQLTDVEIKELAGSWSQPLSFSSSDENTPEMKKEVCENGGDEGKGKNGGLHVPNDLEKSNLLDKKSLNKKKSSCKSKEGEEHAFIVGRSTGSGDKSPQKVGRFLSRRKRGRGKQEPVDVACMKRRKLSDDSCHEQNQSEDVPHKGKEIEDVMKSSKPDIDRKVGVNEDEINVRTNNMRVSSNSGKSSSHGSISGETTKFQEDLSGSIHKVSHGSQALHSGKTTEGNSFATSHEFGCRQRGERTAGDVVREEGENQAHEVVNRTDGILEEDGWSVKQNTISDRADQASDLLTTSNDDENQAKERDNMSENTVSQMNECTSAAKKGGRKGRRCRRSNVNLALLDETNLQESQEHDGLSSRLRKRRRPSYKE